MKTYKYQVKITVGTAPDGTPIRKSFYSSKSLKDAKKKAEEYKINNKAAALAGIVVSKDISFEEWSMKWLEVYKEGKVKQNSYTESYYYPTVKHLIPYFGKHLLSNIKPADIEVFFSSMQKYSQSTLHKLKLCLNQIFESAIDNDYITKNPAKNVQYQSKYEKKAKRAYTANQAAALTEYILDHLEEYPDGLFILIQLKCGLRPEELFGLSWEDFDLKKKTLHVHQAVVAINSKPTITAVKNKRSNRIIPISAELAKLLSHYPRKGMLFDRLMDSSHWSQHRYKTYMTRAASELKIPFLTPHEIRHTCGTILYSNTGNIFAVSRFLGHSSVNITEQIYVHESVEDLRNQLVL